MDATTWPELPYADWRPTKETLHRYAQIRMALTPPRNHWWHVTLRVSALGVTTGPMPYESDAVEIEFDLDHQRMRFRRSPTTRSGPIPIRWRPCSPFESAYRAGATSAGWDLDAFGTPYAVTGG